MKGIVLILALFLSGSVLADNIDTYKFSSVDQEQQYRHLTESLRCQNARTTASPIPTR